MKEKVELAFMEWSAMTDTDHFLFGRFRQNDMAVGDGWVLTQEFSPVFSD